MTFREWLMTSYDNPKVSGQWQILHIGVLLFCITTIILLAMFFRNKNLKTRKLIITILVSLILFFEISRRIINLIKADYNTITFNDFLYTMLPRPWCAISCWLLISTYFVKKDWFYNLCSMSALLCAIIFFIYPEAGFNNLHILFDNFYSVVTHALLLITSITLITFRFTNFSIYNFKKVFISFVCIFIYAFLEIFVLDIENDPLYFMPNNDIINIFGLPYIIYLLLYIIVISAYFLLFFYLGDKKGFVTTYRNIKSKILKKIDSIKEVHEIPSTKQTTKKKGKKDS